MFISVKKNTSNFINNLTNIANIEIMESIKSLTQEKVVNMRTFEIFYNNGNRKFFEAESMTELLQFLLVEGGSQYIYKIELRE